MKLKIFDYLWHIPHQYDLSYALRGECDFYFVPNIKTSWDASKRPVPDNVHFVTEYKHHTYDVAILHIDQRAIHPCSVQQIYLAFDKCITDIPKIVINHGSPVLTEWFDINYPNSSDKQRLKACRSSIKSIIGENVMVVNSHTAASSKEWGFGHPIIHGINPNDFYNLKKERKVFTALSPGGFNDYYNRASLQRVSEKLYEKHGYILNHARVNVDTGSPELYKTQLGSSLIYFDPSFRTPMNRARTEAFLSGCCVVQVEGAHDLDKWAKPGENIVIVPNDPDSIVITLMDLLENKYEQAVTIGKRAKEMAEREFSVSRYKKDWMNLFSEVLISKP